MRLTVEAPFDLGFTFGLRDNAFFTGDRVETLKEKAAEIFQSHVGICGEANPVTSGVIDDFSAAPAGIRAPFGFGLRFQISPGGFTDSWKENAVAFWTRSQESLVREFGHAIYREAGDKLAQVDIAYALVCAFGLGLGYVRLHLNLPRLNSSLAIRAVFKAFENGGYGGFAPERSPNVTLAQWRDLMRTLHESSSNLSALTERNVEPASIAFAGFQGVLIAPDNVPELRDAESFFRPGDARTYIHYGELQVTASWLTTLVFGEPGFEYDYNRFLHTGMGLRLSWEACRVFESVFADKMRMAIQASLEDDRASLSLRQLSRIRQFAALITSNTAIETISDYSGDLEYARFFDGFANITKRHQQIALASNALGQVESDIALTEEREQNRSINTVLLLLTAASLVGVSAGVIQAWNQGLQLVKSTDLLLIALSAPSLLTMLLFISSRLLRQ